MVPPIWATAIASKLVSGKYREDEDKDRKRPDRRLNRGADRTSLPD
ncbi:MAG: hypothetical protein J2P19_29870 [Pseudonocardia sp.]|nr:hypothetical protein [Pseudonocardia sp.]